jgi:ribosomal protein RSM22 (predicted rRNA methylase)
MKVTKSQLKQIIKEELEQQLQERSALDHSLTYAHKQYVEAVMDEYKKLGHHMMPDNISEALNQVIEAHYAAIEAAAGSQGDPRMTNELFGLGAKRQAKALRKKLLPQYSALRDEMDALQDAGKDVTLASRLMDMNNGLRFMMADPNYSEQQLHKQFSRVKAALRDAAKGQ